MKDILIYGNLYDSTELSKKYYSLRDFLASLNLSEKDIGPIVVNDDIELQVIDYFDGNYFRTLEPIDFPFDEYSDYDILKIEIADGGLGFDGGELWTLYELYENLEKWATGHPLAILFLSLLISNYGIPRLKAMFKILKKKGLKCKTSYFSNTIKYVFPKDLDKYIDFKKMEDDLENTK